MSKNYKQNYSKRSEKSAGQGQGKSGSKQGRGLVYWLSLIFLVLIAAVPCGVLLLGGGSSNEAGSASQSTASQSQSSSSNSSSDNAQNNASSNTAASGSSSGEIAWSQIPAYSGEAYVTLNDRPNFTQEELARQSFIDLSDLDDLGRCGSNFALIGTETMPSKDTERGSIREIRPSGWRSVRFDSLKSDDDSDGHVYERSHLLGWALTGLNAEARNLITGTHYFNDESMRPFEVQVARYVEKKSGHVLYRVTPIYDGDDLVARGVRMEALSVEDGGETVCFDVFVYNVQPGFTIDYSDGYITADNGEKAS